MYLTAASTTHGVFFWYLFGASVVCGTLLSVIYLGAEIPLFVL